VVAHRDGLPGHVLAQALRAALPDREIALLPTRVVVDADGAPSPEPLRVLEEPAIRALLDAGVVPICAVGTGVDEDLATMSLARAVGASTLLLLTDIDGVYEDFGTPYARRLARLTPSQPHAMVALGEAAAGSMGPKLRVAARFAESGEAAVIATLEAASEALAGDGGTRIGPVDVAVLAPSDTGGSLALRTRRRVARP
jgi:carbamate kinase